MQGLFERVPGFWTPLHLSQSLCLYRDLFGPSWRPTGWTALMLQGAYCPELLLSQILLKV